MQYVFIVASKLEKVKTAEKACGFFIIVFAFKFMGVLKRAGEFHICS